MDISPSGSRGCEGQVCVHISQIKTTTLIICVIFYFGFRGNKNIG